jgi:hypothetical protein
MQQGLEIAWSVALRRYHVLDEPATPSSPLQGERVTQKEAVLIYGYTYLRVTRLSHEKTYIFIAVLTVIS